MATAKDAEMSPFEAARKLLSSESERMSMGDRVELVFQDMDLVPLLLQVGSSQPFGSDACFKSVADHSG